MNATRLCLALLLLASTAGADQLRIASPEQWTSWNGPLDLLRFDADGALGLRKFRKSIDPVQNAHQFSHPNATGDAVFGGIWRADSNRADASQAIDGDPLTYWQPDPADPLAKWELEIDLGRAVLAQEIRLTFPDSQGARPFRQFSVYTSTGALIQVGNDLFQFESAFQTTLPNNKTQIVIPLTGRFDSTRVVDADLGLDLEGQAKWRTVQMIRFAADAQSEDAALAEIEVVAVGDNISIGALDRGGTFSSGEVTRDPQFMFDGSMNTHANKFTVESKGGWRVDGVWWEMDLGAMFWLDELFIYFNTPGEALSGTTVRNAGTGYSFLFSDGNRTTSGEVDYTHLFTEHETDDLVHPPFLTRRHFRYLFAPRKVRYLFWHGLINEHAEWHARVPELMLYSDGFPAQVTLSSNFVDLGVIAGDGRAKSVKSLSWEADLPPATRLQMRSRSGNTLSEIYTFNDRAGNPVTEARWNSAPAVLRGKIDTTVVTGEDWGEWSNFYQISGEAFKSATPRRYVQLELILSTDDPQVAPTVRNLALDFEDALVRGASGQILPRNAEPNRETRFSYTLWPRAAVGDSGFDQLRFGMGSTLGATDIQVRIGGLEIAPQALKTDEDSLWVTLPAVVQDDSVQVSFTTRLLRNAAVFSLDLGQSTRPGIWQSVEPSSRNANLVFLPDLAQSSTLIGDLKISPKVFSPNGDGVNDQVEIHFALFKVDGATPTVTLYDLAGRRVATLAAPATKPLLSFRWDGRNDQGKLVPPGTYLLQVDAAADAGQSTKIRPIAVAY
jgi:hypothetical protein